MAIRIIDNDAPSWTVMAGSTQVDEGNGEVTITVSTGGVVFPEAQTLELTASGTATAGVDYTVHRGSAQLSGSSYSITLPAGQSSVTATLRMTLDDYTEPAETIVVTAHHNQQAVGTAQTVTITDRGTAGITISGFPDTMREQVDDSYEVALDAPTHPGRNCHRYTQSKYLFPSCEWSSDIHSRQLGHGANGRL